MNLRRHSSGLFLLVALAVVGYLLVSLPPSIIAQYEAAARMSPLWGYVYLGTIGLGGLILGSLGLLMAIRVWSQTRRKRGRRRRRGQDPSELTRQEMRHEFQENIVLGQQLVDDPRLTRALRHEVERSIRELEAKQESQKLEIVAFGTISSGKSSLLNALAGRDVFRSDVVGGTTVTRNTIPWPGNDRVVLVDTPGLAETGGEARAADAADAAKDADVVLFVVDGPLKDYEVVLLRRLGEMQKRVVICLNKEDWFGRAERKDLIRQIAEQACPTVHHNDVVAVTATKTSRNRVRVLADGTESEETVPCEPDIGPLATRMLQIIRRDGRELLLANLLLQSRGLVEEAKRRVEASLDERAEEIINRYMWAAGGAAAVNPFPLLDLAGGSAITVKMVLDLARVYRQEVDADTIVQLLAQLGKNLIAMLGVTAATPAVTAVVASLIKTVPGVGMIAGGLVQGMVQAVVTRWIGKVFCHFFRDQMKTSHAGLAEVAREKWKEVTRADQLRKLVPLGRKRLMRDDDEV